MDGLEAEARSVGHERDQPGSQQGPGQKWAGEQPADLGGRLSLEDQPGPHPDNAQLGVLALEAVELALDRDLVP